MNNKDSCGCVETHWWRMLKVEETDVDGDETNSQDGGDDLGRRVNNGWRGWWHDGRSINAVGNVEKGSE